ncbi:transposase [Treponema endosymbiont of Eucomonympha sp.]|uniref:transposase n=1 Tax=Treponema endosymbiont of Eucomonympha sp. TaxID=1580831 RepID=UPI00164EF456|nr:transposase [Treponema endosymbiont of Eucomonympha sp.]
MKENEGIHWHDISDGAQERIKDLLPGRVGKHGERRKIIVCLSARQTRTGAPRRDMPLEFGNRNSMHKRFCRWQDREYGKRRRTPQ